MNAPSPGTISYALGVALPWLAVASFGLLIRLWMTNKGK
jgi:hypothetical protein